MDKFPGYNTPRKLFNFRVLLPGNYLEKYYFREYLRKNENIFKNILVCESKEKVLWLYEKTQTSKISCYIIYGSYLYPFKKMKL